jgi:hypothetical protein
MKAQAFVLSCIAALVLALVGAAGCKGGESELERALRSIREEQLEIMVLPQEELGDEFGDLEVDDESGFTDNDEAADDTIDPEDTGEDLEGAGRIRGYELTYSDPTFAALEEGVGVISVGSEVELFEDGSAASAFVAKQVDDFRRLEGEEIEVSFRLDEVETFDVEGLADEATGIRARASFGEAEATQTVVAFVFDRLVGAAFLSRADDADVNSQVEAMARALAQRMEEVLLGEVSGTPVPLPEGEEEDEGFVPPPAGAPDLAAMVLSLDDLPAGVSIDREGYVEDEDTVASYEREFDLGLTPIGASLFGSLQNDIDLYDSDVEAAGTFTGMRALFTSETAAEFFASALSAGGGFEATNVSSEPVVLPDLGDASFGVLAAFDSPFGPFRAIWIFVKVDGSIGSLIITAPAGELDPADAVPLAEAMTARMEAVAQ